MLPFFPEIVRCIANNSCTFAARLANNTKEDRFSKKKNMCKYHEIQCNKKKCALQPLHTTRINRRILALFFLLSIFFSSAYAQNTSDESSINLTYQSSLVGIGVASVYDTYLSPQTYTGINIGLLHEQVKMTGWMNERLSSQHLVLLDVSKVMNPPATNMEYTAFGEYGYAMHYRFEPAPHFQVFAGAQVNALFGVIYNIRNGNNPVSMKMNVNAGLSAIAAYRLRIKKQPLKLRYQVNMSTAGVLYSLHYGQSYYEISLGDDKHLFQFASFHNQLIMKNIATAELPFKRAILRLTYLNSLYETDVNDIQTKYYSNSFYIGVASNFFTLTGRKTNPKYKTVYE